MENLTKQEANKAIQGFGINPDVSKVARDAIRFTRIGLVNREPENCRITFTLKEDIDHNEILLHFRDDMHENIVFETSVIEAQNPEV